MPRFFRSCSVKTQATRSQPPAGPSVRRYEAEASTLDGHVMRGAIGADERFLGLRRDNSVNSREGIPRFGVGSKEL